MFYGVYVKHHREKRLVGGGVGRCYGDSRNHHRTKRGVCRYWAHWLGFESGGSLCYGDSWNRHRTEGGLGVGEIFAMGIHGIAMEKREFVLEGVQYANLAMGFMWGSKYIDVPYQISHRGCGIVNPGPLHRGNGLCYGDYVNSHRTERDGSLGSLVS